jgi:N6-adenosine-specific RNA methylase IME4
MTTEKNNIMNEIEKYQGFKAELAVAETYEELKLIETKASVLAELAKKNKVGLEEQNEWGKFRVEIEAKKGDWLDKKFPQGKTKGEAFADLRLRDTTLSKEGITKEESVQARNILHNPNEVQDIIQEIIDSGKSIVTPSLVNTRLKKIKRDIEIQEQVKQIETENITKPTGLYDVVVVDPPWNYGREYDPESSRVANPYPEMNIDEIKSIELPTKDDCILFLWTTHMFLPHAFNILKDWGFDYKATMVWDKEKIGMGYWLRMQCEFCLVGIKGKPIWTNTTERDIIREVRREHSRKPDSFYKLVEKITIGNRLDYFSREQRVNWDNFGNDTKKF